MIKHNQSDHLQTNRHYLLSHDTTQNICSLPLVAIKFVILSLCLLQMLTSSAQNTGVYVPLQRTVWQEYEREMLKLDTIVFNDVRSTIDVNVSRFITFFSPNTDTMVRWKKILFYDDVLEKKGKDFEIRLNPIFNGEYGKVANIDTAKYTTNSRGLQLEGKLGKNISFYSNFIENQSFFPEYLAKWSNKQLVIPGQGVWKTFKTNGMDYFSASGVVDIYLPHPKFKVDIQFGHGKFFVGNGYRSLFLSDNAFNFPYLKFEMATKHLKYTHFWASHHDFTFVYYNYHYRKHSSYSILTWAPHSKIQLSLLESTLWQTSGLDFSNRFSPYYFSPLPLTSTLRYGLDGVNNSFLGGNVNVEILNNLQLYAQFVLDKFPLDKVLKNKDIYSNRSGYQLGAKYFWTSNNNHHKLYVQTERNVVRPYMYTNQKQIIAYTHLNQSLTHPLGASFDENIGIFNYRYKRLLIDIKITQANATLDSTNVSFGSDIMLSNVLSIFNDENFDSNIINQRKYKIDTQTIAISYVINPATNMQISVGTMRRQTNSIYGVHETNYVFIAFRTLLTNFYYDF